MTRFLLKLVILPIYPVATGCEEYTIANLWSCILQLDFRHIKATIVHKAHIHGYRNELLWSYSNAIPRIQ